MIVRQVLEPIFSTCTYVLGCPDSCQANPGQSAPEDCRPAWHVLPGRNFLVRVKAQRGEISSLVS